MRFASPSHPCESSDYSKPRIANLAVSPNFAVSADALQAARRLPGAGYLRRSASTKGARVRRFALVLFIGLLSPISKAQEQVSVASAAYAHLATRGDKSHPTLRTFSFDLNGDGRADAIVLLIGNEWCGSGGCNMLIFRGTESGFSFVSESTIAQEPVMVLPETKHGWHTLIVMSGRTGKVLMRFDGHRYPSNPSVQPKAPSTQVEKAQVLNATLVNG